MQFNSDKKYIGHKTIKSNSILGQHKLRSTVSLSPATALDCRVRSDTYRGRTEKYLFHTANWSDIAANSHLIREWRRNSRFTDAFTSRQHRTRSLNFAE